MARSYLIPDNFIDGGKVFGGTLKARNFIEGIVLGGILALLSFQIPTETLQSRITVTIFMAAPGLLLGVFGVGNDPLSVFLLNIVRWYKSRKTMLFNEAVLGRTDDIVDRMMEQMSPQEILANQLKAMAERGEDREIHLVEGVDFTFESDPELTKYQVPEQNEKRSPLRKRHVAPRQEGK